MKNVLSVGFIGKINALTNPLDGWSKRKGDHDAFMAGLACVEKDDRDILLTWTGGNVKRNITVPRENIAYIEYDEAPAAPVKK